MQSKPHLLATFLLTCAALALGRVDSVQAADKADANGTWTWSVPGRNGGEARTSTLKLKADGDKLTGTLSSPGRQGAAAREVAIEDGKIKGEDVSFTVTRQQGDNKFVQKFTGKLSGDSIKGKMSFDRNGEEQSRDWEAKRGGDKKEEKKEDK